MWFLLIIVGIRSKGRMSVCVFIFFCLFCFLCVFGQYGRGVYVSTMLSSVDEWALFRGCHSHYLNSSHASSFGLVKKNDHTWWIPEQITTPSVHTAGFDWLIYMCVCVCEFNSLSVSSGLTSLATQAGFGSKACCSDETILQEHVEICVLCSGACPLCTLFSVSSCMSSMFVLSSVKIDLELHPVEIYLTY